MAILDRRRHGGRWQRATGARVASSARWAAPIRARRGPRRVSGVHLGERAFAQAVGERLRGVGPLDEQLRALHTGDLYLACAAAGQDPAAITALYQGPLAKVRVALGRAGVPADQADEIVQHLLVHVLAAGADGRVRLLQFQGRGGLVGWLRVMATREFHLRRRRAQRTSARGDEALLKRVETTRDTELTLLRHRYREDFQCAIEEGLRTLTPRERNLLRQELLDGLEQQEIGALYGVHRVTVARWLAAARRRLMAETRRLLRERLGLDTEALKSALRLVRSDLDLSLRGALDDERKDLVDPAATAEPPPSPATSSKS